jgi:hypothetical protein
VLSLDDFGSPGLDKFFADVEDVAINGPIAYRHPGEDSLKEFLAGEDLARPR